MVEVRTLLLHCLKHLSRTIYYIGYVYGNPRNWPFDHWVNQSPNVVVVSVYYRLDSFGFLAHPSFSDSANGDFNVGLQDQIQALKWVQENIAAFGGDPSKVTINGQSAGAGSVQMHMIANEGSQRLFSGGIIQSLDSAEMPTPEQQEVCPFCLPYRRRFRLMRLLTASVQLLRTASGLRRTFSFRDSCMSAER